MKFRFYSHADRDACLQVLESNVPEFFVSPDREIYGAFLDNLPGRYFVVEQSGQVVACGGWALDTAGVADLTWAMVRRDFHHRGLGHELLRFRLKDIQKASRATLVRARTTQLVQGFFVREGFRVIEVVPDGFGAGLDKVTMEIELTRKKISEGRMTRSKSKSRSSGKKRLG